MNEARPARPRRMLRRRTDKIALGLLLVGILATIAGVVAMALEGSSGAWIALVGFALTFGTLAWAIFFRP